MERFNLQLEFRIQVNDFFNKTLLTGVSDLGLLGLNVCGSL